MKTEVVTVGTGNAQWLYNVRQGTAQGAAEHETLKETDLPMTLILTANN